VRSGCCQLGEDVVEQTDGLAPTWVDRPSGAAGSESQRTLGGASLGRLQSPTALDDEMGLWRTELGTSEFREPL